MTVPSPNTFAGATLDRAGHLRADPEADRRAARRPAAPAPCVVREGALVEGDVGSFGADAWDRPTGAVRAVRLPLRPRRRAGAVPRPRARRPPLFALDALPAATPPPGTELLNLRAAAAHPARRATRGCSATPPRCCTGTARHPVLRQVRPRRPRPREGGHVRRCGRATPTTRAPTPS